MLETLTKETWEAYLEQSFDIDADSQQPLQIRLTEVSGYGRRLGAQREAYSLMFRGPAQPVLMQRIYTVRHEKMGPLAIFLVPIGPDVQGMRYEAVFT